MLKDRLIAALLLIILVIPAAHADLPLTIENLLTAEQYWRADINIESVKTCKYLIISSCALSLTR